MRRQMHLNKQAGQVFRAPLAGHHQRLDRGTYRLPLVIPPGAVEVTLTARQLETLLEGLDERLLRRARQIALESQHQA